MPTITWLHLSDLHFQADERQTWNEDIVLRALLDDVRKHVDEGLNPDLILVTGDIAFSGAPAEYVLAEQFFDNLRQATNLPKERLFLVPGNHDVDRKQIGFMAKQISPTLTSRDAVNGLLADPDARRTFLARFGGYAAFLDAYFAGHLSSDDDYYFYVRPLDLAGQRVTVLGLNSAWLARGGEEDRNRLALGERQVRAALDAAGDADLKIALMHHPFDWLRDFDRADAEALLRGGCEFMLHGHLHQAGLVQTRTPDTECLVIAAGASYETRQSRNAYNLAQLDLGTGQGQVYLRMYSDRGGGFWTKDVLTYKNVEDGLYEFPLPGRLRPVPTRDGDRAPADRHQDRADDMSPDPGGVTLKIDSGGGTVVLGDVRVEGGDFVGGARLQRWVGEPYLDRPPDRMPPNALLQAYHRALATECSRLPLGVVDPRFLQTDTGPSVALDNVYVDLEVVAPLGGEEEKEASRQMGRLARGEGGERTPLLEVLAEPQATRLVLLGDPGSGKTTFVHYLAFALARASNEQARSALLPDDSLLQGMLPVRLVLREAAARCIPLEAERGEAGMLWSALWADLAARLGEGAADKLLPYLQERLLEEGGLVLLDGLDEVPEADRRRECLLEAVADLAALLPPERSRVVVTARPYAYADPRWRLAGFRTLVLAPFDDDQVARFITRWYRAVGPVMGWDEWTARERGERLQEALAERPYLADLASRPLLLTLMTTLHTSWGQLPEDRADLYEETVKLLLSRWQRVREVKGPDGQTTIEPGIAQVLAAEEKRTRMALHRLAFEAHERQRAEGVREVVPADIREGEVLAAFASLLPQDLDPRVLLSYLETRAGLLVGRTPGVYAFPHRSFQEYLAACYLADRPDSARELRRHVWQDPDWWREVYLLGVGKARLGGMGNAVHAVNTLVPEGPHDEPQPTVTHWKAAVLAGQALVDLRFPASAQGEPDFEAVLKRLRRWLAALLERPDALAPRERAEAGDVLGKLGDPRPGVGVVVRAAGESPLPDLVWCQVPAGPFLMGSQEDEQDGYDDEKPQHTLALPAYLISRYPVTNAQYRPFVEGGGYDEPRHWTPDGWAWRTGQREPDLSAIDDEDLKKDWANWLAGRPAEKRDRPFWWEHPRWSLASRPVVGVTWYKALAYCAWLTDRMQDAGSGIQVWQDGEIEPLNPESGACVVQLPTEAEWEKAARGTDGHRWPWGNEWFEGRANTQEAGVEETSAAGAFPAGTSLYGVLDMAGNIWEWTRSRWGRTSILRPDYGYPYDVGDGREESTGPDLRVLRGGSWGDDQWYARCAARDGDYPGDFDFNVGFRVVVSLASSEC